MFNQSPTTFTTPTPNIPSPNQPKQTITSASMVNQFLTKTFSIMGIAILISGLVAYLCASFGKTFLMNSPVSFIVGIIILFAMPFIIDHVSFKNAFLAIILLFIFSCIMGATCSYIFLAYTASSITSAFVSSSAIFITMGIIGKCTHKDLSHLGTQLFGALIALIIASVISIFFYNSLIILLLDVASIIIFSLLTMFDTNNLVQLFKTYQQDTNIINGISIVGALNLYLDFINIFLSILELFGGASNSKN